jgi:hypothetical protein
MCCSGPGNSNGPAMLYGAEESMRERLAMPNPHAEQELQEILDLLGGSVSAADWGRLSRAGRSHPVEAVLRDLAQPRPQPVATD